MSFNWALLLASGLYMYHGVTTGEGNVAFACILIAMANLLLMWR